jgi:hypothetical protein
MDIFFRDPNEIPLAPKEVRIRALTVSPYEDGRRVRVYLELDSFQKRPCLDLTVHDQGGAQAAQTSIIETMMRKIELTMHLRGENLQNPYTLSAVVFYQKSSEANDEKGDAQIGIDDPMIVDQRQVRFDMTLPEG